MIKRLKTALQISAGAVVAATTAFGGSAEAITLRSSAGEFSNVDGGQHVVIGTTNAGEEQVRWGDPAYAAPTVHREKSGLGFKGVGETELAAGQVFKLGRLRHFNNPIWSGTQANGVDLSVTLDFEELGEQVFDFALNIDETPNIAGTCVYETDTGNPCADRIYWDGLISNQSLSISGKDYSLEVVGFKQGQHGDIVEDFISQEGGTSSAWIYAQLFEHESPEGPSVPEPTAVVGLLGAGALTKLRKAKK
ncbi:MAG: THxN family PEP-CTERM protein [Cyanobacteria bacterium P01_H01_bin.121]